MPLTTTPRRFYHLIGVQSPFDPIHALVTSPLFGPLSLAAVRILLGLYTLITLIVTLVWNVQDGVGSQCVYLLLLIDSRWIISLY